MSRNLTNECEANDFDLELFRLMQRAQRAADYYREFRTTWLEIAAALSAIRPDARMMMSTKDRESTL